jgi:IS605 OrfB family transposase
LNYCKYQKQFYINLIFQSDDPLQIAGDILGIDRGIYNLATTSEGQNFSGNGIRSVQRRYLFNRKMLQAKGTPSARHLLKKMSGKEKRFSRDVNHVITKKISRLPFFVFVLENLTSIRTQRRGKKMNKWLSSWPFFQFEQFLTYKAGALGKKVEYVDAHYTSRKCSRCGNRSRHNRWKSHFVCSVCGFRIHADFNAGINIKNNYILSITERSMEQGSVNSPHESSGIALCNALCR